ncbi:MAG: PAQR family membrane homeostasis protein TrhA [Isosphaeraceae bacterium]
MSLLDPREPVSAWSHACGLIMSLAVTWLFWKLSRNRRARDAHPTPTLYETGKFVGLLIFGFSLVFCYGASTLYHAAWTTGDSLNKLREIDHVGIYLLIAGSYTPAAWSLLKGPWRRGTLATVWGTAAVCVLRVWLGGTLPSWVSTSIYLCMGWGVVFCYRELARDLGHRTLLPLPVGGVFYSVGAIINLAGWPVLVPGFLGAHDLFHFFVIAGSASHVIFMVRAVIPADQPDGWRDRPDLSSAVPPPHLASLVPGSLVLHQPMRAAALANDQGQQHAAQRQDH